MPSLLVELIISTCHIRAAKAVAPTITARLAPCLTAGQPGAQAGQRAAHGALRQGRDRRQAGGDDGGAGLDAGPKGVAVDHVGGVLGILDGEAGGVGDVDDAHAVVEARDGGRDAAAENKLVSAQVSSRCGRKQRVTNKSPSQKMPIRDSLRRRLICSLRIAGSGSASTRMSKKTSSAAMVMIHAPRFRSVRPRWFQKSEMGQAENMAD